MPFITQGKTNWKFLLIVIILAIIVGGGALWYVKRPEKPYQPVVIQKTAKASEEGIASWQTYVSPENDFTFQYPKDWEILNDYFNESATGIKSEVRSIYLGKIGNESPNDWIRLHPIKFQSDVGTCKGAWCTYSKDSAVLNILSEIVKTYKYTEAIFVYLTDKKYDGNLGGRQGADAKCSPPSVLDCKPKTAHAFLTINTDDSIKNMYENYNFKRYIPIYWYNRETAEKIILANTWIEMFDKDIKGIINGQKEGTGKGEWSGDFPWTGGLGDENTLATCNQWTSNVGDLETAAGPYGTIGGVDKEFLFTSDGWAGISFSMVCKNTRYLRCLCKGSI